MTRLLQEPLLHFLLLGAVVFLGYSALERTDDVGGDRIVVTQGQIDNLRLSYTRVWQRPPTPSELQGLIREHVREEVMAREAVKLGLDRDDIVIRRRLRQKMEFLAIDLAVPDEPTDAQLEAFLSAHPERFEIEPRLTLRQVYLDPARRGDTLTDSATSLLPELNRPGTDADFRSLGDPTMLRAEMRDASVAEVAQEFGDEFARRVEASPAGQWSGPVTSGYGSHLVFVAARTPGRIPALAEIREDVSREWTDAQRVEQNERFYDELLKRYSVTIEPAPDPTGSVRTARAQ